MKRYKQSIYPLPIYITNDVEEFNKYFTHIDGSPLKFDNALATTYRIVGKKEKRAAIGIVLGCKPSISTIAHEAFHAANFILEYVGADFFMDGTNEHWAYLIGWVAECIQDFSNQSFKEGDGEEKKD